MEKGSRYGRKEQEAAWQHAEVDALYRLAAAGVRVPTPYNFHEGVLLMELVADENGEPAPRLNDVVLSEDVARQYHAVLLRQVVRMRCAGIVHGDLSEYNVLVDSDGPVIIDLPQAIDAAANNNASPMLERARMPPMRKASGWRRNSRAPRSILTDRRPAAPGSSGPRPCEDPVAVRGEVGWRRTDEQSRRSCPR